jgi:hypothetical protein
MESLPDGVRGLPIRSPAPQLLELHDPEPPIGSDAVRSYTALIQKPGSTRAGFARVDLVGVIG